MEITPLQPKRNTNETRQAHRFLDAFGASMLVGFIASATLAIISLQWDRSVSDFVREMHVPGDLRKAVNLCEVFAHGIGCIVILGTLWWVDLSKRRELIRVAIFTAICGVLANLAKGVIPRHRPYTSDLQTAELEQTPADAIWSTWGSPFTESWFDETIRSFPSGHTATAIALAIGLSHAYPRGRFIFAAIALVACFQRMQSGAHFPSDVLASVALTCIIAVLYWHPRHRRANVINSQ